MALPPSSTAPFAAYSLLSFLPVTKKLTKNNFPMWEEQIMSALHGAQVAHFISSVSKQPEQFLAPKGGKKSDGDDVEPPVENLEFEKWVAKDQQVLSFLLTSLGKEIGSQVTYVKTAVEAWKAITSLHAS